MISACRLMLRGKMGEALYVRPKHL
jgi:hypothetical protein